MNKLVRGNIVVIGVTGENLVQLVQGKVISFPGEQIGDPGRLYYFVKAEDECMLTLLRNAGYDIP